MAAIHDWLLTQHSIEILLKSEAGVIYVDFRLGRMTLN